MWLVRSIELGQRAMDGRPLADNRRVLTEYSKDMKELLEKQKYNSAKRPSQHNIGAKSFLTNNDGAIPSRIFITICGPQAPWDSGGRRDLAEQCASCEDLRVAPAAATFASSGRQEV